MTRKLGLLLKYLFTHSFPIMLIIGTYKCAINFFLTEIIITGVYHSM
jgi:hypothetical protein